MWTQKFNYLIYLIVLLDWSLTSRTQPADNIIPVYQIKERTWRVKTPSSRFWVVVCFFFFFVKKGCCLLLSTYSAIFNYLILSSFWIVVLEVFAAYCCWTIGSFFIGSVRRLCIIVSYRFSNVSLIGILDFSLYFIVLTFHFIIVSLCFS
jgi:hypothetical protein